MISASERAHPAVGRLAAGTASREEGRQAIGHLLAGCESCRAQLAAELRPPTDETALAAAVDRAVAGVTALLPRVAAARDRAGALADRYRELTAAERPRLLAGLDADTRRGLVRCLLERSRAQRHSSAADGLLWAELAVSAGERPADDELAAEAWAELGNARRIASDLAGAETALDEADRRLRRVGADPLLEAELLALRGSLANYQRRFTAAVELLERAARLYALYGDPLGVAITLLRLGQAHGERGEPLAGIPAVSAALELLDRPEDASLRRIGVHTLIYLLSQSGDAVGAAELIERAAPLVAAAPPLERLRFDWLRGRLEHDLGAAAPAAERLERVRQSYQALGVPYENALVSLDLATIYADLGRRRELAALAAASTPVFRRLGIGREHLASLAVLAQVGAGDATARIATLIAAVQQARQRSSGSAVPKV